MKKLAVLFIVLFLTSLSARASVLFSDLFNYPNGVIETDGVWQVYSPAPPAAPYKDAFVESNLLILNSTNHDAVDAPFTTNRGGSTVVFASFTIKVTQLPSAGSGFFCEFQDVSNVDEVGYVFITTNNTQVPGTYRLGINNYVQTSSLTTGKVALYPLDMATNLTYHVVFSFDTAQTDPFPGATLVVNPASMTDYADSPAFGTDNAPTAGQTSIDISAIGFSQYANQGIIDIGDLFIGTSFGDVFTNTPQKPVIGVQPQPAGLFSGNNVTLYTAADGLGQLTYQWYSNNVALSDNGVTVVGSLTNIINLSNLQATANYTVVVANSAGSVTSIVAQVTVTNTPTPPYFITVPVGTTNGLGATVTLTALANGTGPLTYAWYFEETNTSTFTQVGTGPTLTLSAINFAQSGSYYVTASGGQGSLNSPTVTVQVVPPPLVSIGYLHSLLAASPPNTTNLNNGAIYSIRGVITTFGEIGSKTYSEYYLQDGTGGSLAFINGTGNTNTPPAGTLVQITGPVQEYYGEIELDPNVTYATNNITVISSNNPIPAPQPLNLALMATNPMGAYGIGIQCSLVTLTNVWLYSSTAGAAVSGNFPTNGTKALYAYTQPWVSTNQPYMEVFVYTYTNTVNTLNTNYFGQPIPSFAYEITGAMGIYSPTVPELYPTRYQDFVTTPPAAFHVGIASTNGVSTISWPTAVGPTYSLYSAPTLTGPWTQTFGLGYYPNPGSIVMTNGSSNQFYEMSSP